MSDIRILDKEKVLNFIVINIHSINVYKDETTNTNRSSDFDNKS